MGKITYNRGTTYSIQVNYTNTNGVLGATAMFTAKQTQYDADATDSAAFAKVDAPITSGSASIAITPGMVADSVPAGNFFYDVKVLDANGAIYLIDSGSFILQATPTNRLT